AAPIRQSPHLPEVPVAPRAILRMATLPDKERTTNLLNFRIIQDLTVGLGQCDSGNFEVVINGFAPCDLAVHSHQIAGSALPSPVESGRSGFYEIIIWFFSIAGIIESQFLD